MEFEGSKDALANLIKKQRRLAVGDETHRQIRTLLIALWGTMRGVYGGGQVIALEQAGLTDMFDTVIGVSTGAPILAYFLAGQSELGTSIYCEECTTEAFMSLRELKIDVGYLASIFRGDIGAKPLDQDAVRASRSRFLAGVTCANAGTGEFLEVRRASPDPVQALIASIALPGFTEPVELNGRTYLDGGGGMPFPLFESLDRFAPTDVLVLANRPRREKMAYTLIRDLATKIATRGLELPVRNAYATRHARFAKEVSAFRSGAYRTNIGIIWTDDEVGPYERQPAKLLAARDRAHNHMTRLLREARDPT